MSKYRSLEHSIKDMLESSITGGKYVGSRGGSFRKSSTSNPDEWRDKSGTDVGAARNIEHEKASVEKAQNSENTKEKEIAKRTKEAEQRKKETMKMAKEDYSLEEQKYGGTDTETLKSIHQRAHSDISHQSSKKLKMSNPGFASRVDTEFLARKELKKRGVSVDRPKHPAIIEASEASGTTERTKIKNVARPDDPNPTSSQSKLSKQAELKTKIIDEGKMLRSDKKFGISDSIIEAAKAVMSGKTEVDTAPETNDSDSDDDNGMKKESKHTKPKTAKEKSLAALAHPKDKITHKDVLVGRGVLAKEDVDIDNLTEEQLEEVLKKSDPAGKWISDFVHSKDPKFAGKTKKERMKMALGAYYAKQRNEEVFSDDEIDRLEEIAKKFD